MAADAGGRIYFGTAGWSYDDWRGVVYPDPAPRGFNTLTFIARYVGVAEVNASFYRIPTARQAEGWLRAVAGRPDFLFTMKLWQGFTHEADWPGEEAARRFREAARTLADGGRLAGALAQFPWSFKFGPAALERLERLADGFGDLGLVFEPRHASWLRDETFDWLRRRAVAFCNIDQPVIGASIPPTAIVTAPTAYLRLHGRRHDTWFAADAAPHERYNYLYQTAELDEWAGRLRGMLPKAERTLAIGNNHYRGKAVAAVAELEHLLTGARPLVPATLARAYPRLRDFCRIEETDGGPARPGDGQLSLF